MLITTHHSAETAYPKPDKERRKGCCFCIFHEQRSLCTFGGAWLPLCWRSLVVGEEVCKEVCADNLVVKNFAATLLWKGYARSLSQHGRVSIRRQCHSIARAYVLFADHLTDRTVSAPKALECTCFSCWFGDIAQWIPNSMAAPVA